MNIAEAPSVASAGSVTGVRGWLERHFLTPEDAVDVRHGGEAFVFRCKPGALGVLAIDQIVTIDGVAYRYLGEAPHGPSLFQHLQLSREVG